MSFEYTFLEKEKGRSACIVFSQCAFYRKGGTPMPVLNRVAQAAGIQAAKHNWELIPMCHPLPLTGIDISFHLSDQPCMVEIRAAVTCISVTGVDSATPEMCGQAIYPATVMQGEKEESAARLSGCKNIVEAVPAGNAVTLPQWGLTLDCGKAVPADVRWAGIRAHHVTAAPEGTEGAFLCAVERVIQDVFTTIVLLRPEHAAPDAPPLRMELEREDAPTVLDNQLVWISVQPRDILLLR